MTIGQLNVLRISPRFDSYPTIARLVSDLLFGEAKLHQGLYDESEIQTLAAILPRHHHAFIMLVDSLWLGTGMLMISKSPDQHLQQQNDTVSSLSSMVTELTV